MYFISEILKYVHIYVHSQQFYFTKNLCNINNLIPIILFYSRDVLSENLTRIILVIGFNVEKSTLFIIYLFYSRDISFLIFILVYPFWSLEYNRRKISEQEFTRNYP